MWGVHMRDNLAKLNNTFVEVFNFILYHEETFMAAYTGGRLSLREIHVIEQVCKATQKGDNTMGAVAKALFITVGTLTVTVNNLVRKRFIIKEKGVEDKRMVFISPTEDAYAINELHLKFHRGFIEEIDKLLNNEQFAALDNALTAIQKYLNQ